MYVIEAQLCVCIDEVYVLNDVYIFEVVDKKIVAFQGGAQVSNMGGCVFAFLSSYVFFSYKNKTTVAEETSPEPGGHRLSLSLTVDLF